MPGSDAFLRWRTAATESASLAVESVRTQPVRSGLAISGIVIGIVTVVVVASVLAGVRNSIANLFRDLGTENVFAFHLTGDPYQPASEREARRRPLDPAFAPEIARLGDAVETVGVQLIVPPVVSGRALTARVGGNEVDTVLVEGASPNNFEVTGAEFAAGRPFTDLENRAAAPWSSSAPTSSRPCSATTREGARWGVRSCSAARPITSWGSSRPGRAGSSARTGTTTSCRCRWGPRRGGSRRPRTRCCT